MAARSASARRAPAAAARAGRGRWAGALAAGLLLAAAGPAAADDDWTPPVPVRRPTDESLTLPPSEPLPRRNPSSDGAYGRLEGDVAASVEGGLSAGSHTTGIAQVRLLYLATAGVQATWFAPRDGQPATVSVGAEVRPLFLGRFLTDHAQGPARLDLLIDSLHLGMAARLGGDQRPGLDLSAGVELPLNASFSGVFLGLTGLWRLPHDALLGPGQSEGQALLTIGLRGLFATHVVDAHDRVMR